MRLLCRIGWHRFRPHYRALREPKHEQMLLPIVPSLFSGPPFLIPTGVWYVKTHELVGRRCSRCGEARK